MNKTNFMKMKLIVIFAILAMASCRKQTLNEEVIGSDSIVGKWTSDYLKGKIEFSADSNKAFNLTFPFYIKKLSNTAPEEFKINVEGTWSMSLGGSELHTQKFRILNEQVALDVDTEKIFTAALTQMKGSRIVILNNYNSDSAVLFSENDILMMSH